jgi:hypothetical protein
MMDEADNLMKEILTKKFELEKKGKTPRIVLLGKKEHKLLEQGWIESVRELPWGDSLMYELEMRENKNDVFLGDGSIFDLWVIEVDTIEGFKVY